MITKPTVVVTFNLQNSHSLTLSLPTEGAFQVNGQNGPVTNLPVVLFSFSAERNANTKATENVTFGFNLTVCQQYRVFSVLVAI